jgi:hypothetical protein
MGSCWSPPKNSGLVNVQARITPVCELDFHEAALQKVQGQNHFGREREMAGETRVYHGLDLDATPPQRFRDRAVEYREGDHGLASALDDAATHGRYLIPNGKLGPMESAPPIRWAARRPTRIR